MIARRMTLGVRLVLDKKGDKGGEYNAGVILPPVWQQYQNPMVKLVRLTFWSTLALLIQPHNRRAIQEGR